MNVFTQMDLHKGEFTPRELEIYELFSSSPDVVAGSTTTTLSRQFNIPQSAISRFCKKIGFSGYGDFRMNMMVSAAHQHEQQSADGEEDIADHLTNYCHNVREVVTDDVLEEVTQEVLSARRIYTCGEASSSIPAQYLAFMLMELSLPGQFITSGWEQEMLHCMDEQDLVLLFSARNPTHEAFLATLRELNVKRQPHVRLITYSANHPLRSLVDKITLLPTRRSSQRTGLMDSSNSMLFFGIFLSDYLTRKLEQ